MESINSKLRLSYYDGKGLVGKSFSANEAVIKYKAKRKRFERGFCEVWTDDFDRMFEIIYAHVTCKQIGLRLVSKLMRAIEFNTGDIYINQTELAKELKVTRPRLTATLGQFVELGLLIQVGKQSRHNIYRFPEHIVWKGDAAHRLKLMQGGK